jgi:hypothetical protein
MAPMQRRIPASVDERILVKDGGKTANMSLADRIGRSLFVALAVGLAWGIRGDFGHLVGAMYPGAVLGLAVAYVSGQRSLFLWMPILAALAALGIGSGGMMSYALLHGYAQSNTLVNYAYGFAALFLQGSAWGTFGGALFALLLERKPMRTGEWLGLVGTALFAGWITSFVVVDILGFQINPPRNNDSIAFMGAALGQLIWLACNHKPSGLRGAVLGYVGLGIGMAGGRLLGNVANVLQAPYSFTINHWNVMETSCGFIGGFIYCFGMVGRAYPEPPERENIPLASCYGILYVLGLIPLWHRLNRISPTRVKEWVTSLMSYGYAEPNRLAQANLRLIDAVCVAGFVGAALWLVIYFKRRDRWSALPVMWLSGTMLLFQNLAALYFYYPARAHYINMHNVFWGMFVSMCVYAIFARPRPVIEVETAHDASEAGFAWARWLAGAIAALALIIFLAGYVNNDRTMATANTRWPVWSWHDGPFPGRGGKP